MAQQLRNAEESIYQNEGGEPIYQNQLNTGIGLNDVSLYDVDPPYENLRDLGPRTTREGHNAEEMQKALKTPVRAGNRDTDYSISQRLASPQELERRFAEEEAVKAEHKPSLWSRFMSSRFIESIASLFQKIVKSDHSTSSAHSDANKNNRRAENLAQKRQPQQHHYNTPPGDMHARAARYNARMAEQSARQSDPGYASIDDIHGATNKAKPAPVSITARNISQAANAANPEPLYSTVNKPNKATNATAQDAGQAADAAKPSPLYSTVNKPDRAANTATTTAADGEELLYAEIAPEKNPVKIQGFTGKYQTKSHKPQTQRLQEQESNYASISKS